MIGRLIRNAGAMLDDLRLPAEAKAEVRRDRAGNVAADPGIGRVVAEGLGWLARAQDHSTSRDGGVARHYSLIDGWSTSYPETTGYIVPTLIDSARRLGDGVLRERARRMLDWLVSIQMPGGGFQGGMIGQEPVVPVTFNTGQILIGLAAGVREFGDEYLAPMRAAADFLVDSQDPDGAWRRNPTPFAKPGLKTYETHVAWGLLEAARVVPNAPYGEAGLRNIRWAIGQQQPNGWLANCCLSDPMQPLTHTLGYALRGVVEGYLFSRDEALLAAARRMADGLVSALRLDDGFLPGRLDGQWRGTVGWACLTGSVQVAHSLLLLYQETGHGGYRDAARAANRYVRRTVRVEGNPDTRGAVKGSFPVDGGYGRFQYLNWAAKFCIDANLLEAAVVSADASPGNGRR